MVESFSMERRTSKTANVGSGGGNKAYGSTSSDRKSHNQNKIVIDFPTRKPHHGKPVKVMPGRKDAVTFTSFPAPGTSLDTPTLKEEHTKSEAQDKSVESSISTSRMQSRRILRQKYGTTRHWIPDASVTACFECARPFHMFRRRHHCRLCGQIFCFECSPHFIDGSVYGLKRDVRVCNYCVSVTQLPSHLSRDNEYSISSLGPNGQSSVRVRKSETNEGPSSPWQRREGNHASRVDTTSAAGRAPAISESSTRDTTIVTEHASPPVGQQSNQGRFGKCLREEETATHGRQSGSELQEESASIDPPVAVRSLPEQRRPGDLRPKPEDSFVSPPSTIPAKLKPSVLFNDVMPMVEKTSTEQLVVVGQPATARDLGISLSPSVFAHSIERRYSVCTTSLEQLAQEPAVVESLRERASLVAPSLSDLALDALNQQEKEKDAYREQGPKSPRIDQNYKGNGAAPAREERSSQGKRLQIQSAATSSTSNPSCESLADPEHTIITLIVPQNPYTGSEAQGEPTVRTPLFQSPPSLPLPRGSHSGTSISYSISGTTTKPSADKAAFGTRPNSLPAPAAASLYPRVTPPSPCADISKSGNMVERPLSPFRPSPSSMRERTVPSVLPFFAVSPPASPLHRSKYTSEQFQSPKQHKNTGTKPPTNQTAVNKTIGGHGPLSPPVSQARQRWTGQDGEFQNLGRPDFLDQQNPFSPEGTGEGGSHFATADIESGDRWRQESETQACQSIFAAGLAGAHMQDKSKRSSSMIAPPYNETEFRLSQEKLFVLVKEHLRNVIGALVRASPELCLNKTSAEPFGVGPGRDSTGDCVGEYEPDNDREIENYSDTILRLVLEAAFTVDPAVHMDSGMDIRPYVKVKKVAGGWYTDSTLLYGALFQKRPAHKRSKTTLDTPRILLLAGGIQFDRAEARLSSLDALIEQEKQYTEMLVDKIRSLHPDLIFIEKGVSRYAQELLHKEGIIVVQHVRPSQLWRISALTGAYVLPTCDHVDRAGEKVLGTCGSFRFQRYPTCVASLTNPGLQGTFSSQRGPALAQSNLPVPPVLHSSSSLSAISSLQKEFVGSPSRFWLSPQSTSSSRDCTERNSENRAESGNSELGQERERERAERERERDREETYATVDGCAPIAGCSLLLRGESKIELEAAKQLVQFALFVAYNLRLEAAYLADSFLMIDTQQDDNGPTKKDKKHSSVNVNSKLACQKEGDGPQWGMCSHRSTLKRTSLLSASLALDKSIHYRKRRRAQPSNGLSDLKSKLNMMPSVLSSTSGEGSRCASEASMECGCGEVSVLSSLEEVSRSVSHHQSLQLCTTWLRKRGVASVFPRASSSSSSTATSGSSYSASSMGNSTTPSGDGIRESLAQCSVAEVKEVRFYTDHDRPLGQYLFEACFDQAQHCLNSKCGQSPMQHLQAFAHGNAHVAIETFSIPKELPTRGDSESVPTCTQPSAAKSIFRLVFFSCWKPHQQPIWMWRYCQNCSRIVSPMTQMSADCWKFSFGKFLELLFHNKYLRCRSGLCPHDPSVHHAQFFGQRSIVAVVRRGELRPLHVAFHNATTLAPDKVFFSTVEQRNLKLLQVVANSTFDAFLQQTSVLERSLRRLLAHAKRCGVDDASLPSDHAAGQGIPGSATHSCLGSTCTNLACSSQSCGSFQGRRLGIALSEGGGERTACVMGLRRMTTELLLLRDDLNRSREKLDDRIRASLFVQDPQASKVAAQGRISHLTKLSFAPESTCGQNQKTVERCADQQDPRNQQSEAECRGVKAAREPDQKSPRLGSVGPAAHAQVSINIPNDETRANSLRRSLFLAAQIWSGRIDFMYELLKGIRTILKTDSAWKKGTTTELEPMPRQRPNLNEAEQGDDDLQLDKGGATLAAGNTTDSSISLQQGQEEGINTTATKSPDSASIALAAERRIGKETTLSIGDSGPDTDQNAPSLERIIKSNAGTSVYTSDTERPQSLHKEDRLEENSSRPSAGRNNEKGPVRSLEVPQLEELRRCEMDVKKAPDSMSSLLATAWKEVLVDLRSWTGRTGADSTDSPGRGNGRAIGANPTPHGRRQVSSQDGISGLQETEEEHSSRIPLADELSEGRPGLSPGVTGEVILVYDEIPATIIAHVLRSSYYMNQLEAAMGVVVKPNFKGSVVPTSGESRGPGVSQKQEVWSVPENRFRPDSSRIPDSENMKDGIAVPEDGAASGPDGCQTSNFGSENTFIGGRDEKTLATTCMDTSSEGAQGNPALLSPSSSRDDLSLHSVQSVSSNEETLDIPTATHQELDSNVIDRPYDPDTLQRLILMQRNGHIKHKFSDKKRKRYKKTSGTFSTTDSEEKTCLFTCRVYWAAQFFALRRAFTGSESDFALSLSLCTAWKASGGKSGAIFGKTPDGRFIVKEISRTEMQMFVELAPAYFEYISKALFNALPSLLAKVLGVYEIVIHDTVSGVKNRHNVVIMENVFHSWIPNRIFDLKGSSRNRYVQCSSPSSSSSPASKTSDSPTVLWDENFMEYTNGRALPVQEFSHTLLHRAIQNDSLFLSIINVVDYSILVGIDEQNDQMAVGVIDYLHQFDLRKRMESVGKSVAMFAGQAEPTIVQPDQYRDRFQEAMRRYFMAVPAKHSVFRLVSRSLSSPPSPRLAVQKASLRTGHLQQGNSPVACDSEDKKHDSVPR